MRYEVEIKKSLFTGREELETGRKVLTAEEFEKVQQTISSAERIIEDYEDIKNTDLYKQNESLKEQNHDLSLEKYRLQEMNRITSSELNIESGKREKAERVYQAFDDLEL